MSLAVWHLLILWMTLISRPIMSEARFPYVSEFEYVPGLHPSRNLDCPSGFIEKREIEEDTNVWNRPSIEIRAVLTRCSKTSSYLDGRRSYSKDQGITNCTRKIVINMRFNHIGKTETQEKFIVIDHVLDPATMKKIPLQNPYVIKVRQEAVLQLYGLKFQSVVNAEAREEVINNEDPNYTGCNVGSEKPTCGRSFMRGVPVPYSQGFCCSCDPKVNARRQFAGSNDSLETSDATTKSNYYVTNKPRNRLPKPDPMAERQSTENEEGSTKKSSTRPADSDADRTTGTGASGLNARRGGELIDRFSSMSLRGNKGENDRVSGQKEATKSHEKHSGEQGDGRSTSVSSTGPEVSLGKPPSGDKTASDTSVAHVTPTIRKNLSVEKSGKPGFVEKHRDHAKTLDKGRLNAGGSISDAKRFNSMKEDPKNRRGSVTKNEKSNLQLQLVDSKPETKKILRNREKQADQSKDQRSQDKRINSSLNLIRSRGALPSSKPELKKKWRKKAKEDDRKGDFPVGNKAALPKKRNKAFPVTSAIDSLPIHPAMHLNEPLKNFSTGVLNSNGSPVSQSPRHPAEGNLNRVMESTSRRPDIRVKSFNEKHGTLEAEYPRAKKKIQSLEDVGLKLLSESINLEQNILSHDDCLNSVKDRPCKESIKNYTPQKRTLKNLSYRKNNRHRDRRNQNEHEVDAHQSEKSLGRANGPFRDGRKRRRSSRRRRRRSKRQDDVEGFASDKKNPEKKVRVYIDNSRPIQGSSKAESRFRKLGHRRMKSKKLDRGQEESENSQESDSLDKRIEEKFSRINDVLKEDMGSKVNVEETQNDRATTKNLVEDTNYESSLQKNEETLNEGASDEATQPVIEEDAFKHDFKEDSDTNLFPEAENLAKTGEISDRLPENKFEESKSPTPNWDLIISPTMGSPIRPDSSVTESLVNYNDFASTQITQALIVVDFFKVVPTEPTGATETLKPTNGSTMAEKIGNLGKSIQKALGLQPQTQAPRETIVIGGTSNDTRTMENVTEATTSAETTRITDQAFRPSIKSFQSAAKQTSGEFHNEVAIGELDLPEDFNVVTATSAPIVPRRFDLTPGMEGSMDTRRRKKKRKIKGRGSSLQGGSRRRQAGRFHRSIRDDDPGYSEGKDSMKFAFEAGNVRMMGEKLGSKSSFLREQRDYMQLTVNGPSDAEQRNDKKRKAPFEVTDSSRSNWIHHPWSATTESSEYTVKSKDHADRVQPSKGLPNKGNRVQKESNASNPPEISGRILPPCTKRYRRSRRLLSVQNPKNTKHHQQRSTKSQKKVQDHMYVKDEDSDDYESTSKHGKDSKSSLEKSKKRNTVRSTKKRKEDGKNRRKKQLKSPLEENFEIYDYSMPKEQYDVLEERQAVDVDSPEEALEAEVPVSSIEESAGKIIPEVQNDDSFGRLVDDGVPVDFDRLPDDSKTENGAKQREESAKDFDISLTGKIHLESDSNGRPVSISFNAAPETLPKDGAAPARTNEYADRFPAPRSSFVDAANADNANFLSDPLMQPVPVDPEEADDRSAVIRDRNRNVGRYRDMGSQKLLRLQKKSVEAIKNADEEEIRSAKGLRQVDEKGDGSEGNLMNLEPSSVKIDVNSDSKEKPVESKDVSFDSESLKSVAPAADENAPQVSLDLSNEPEVSILKNEAEDTNAGITIPLSAGCYALSNITNQKIDLPETTTNVEKIAISNTKYYSYQDLNLTGYSDNPESNSQLESGTPSSIYENALEEALLPVKQQALALPNDAVESYLSPLDGKETTEKKNMMAVAEFVKKLEKLVTDAGNSSNKTGHTLVHLKKFVIVPDNQTFWSLGKLSEPEASLESTTADTVVLIGEGARQNEKYASSKDEEREEDETEQKPKSEEPDAIKEIISSVLRGDDEKRDAVSGKVDEFSSSEELESSPEEEEKLESSIKMRDGTSLSRENELLDVESKYDDQSLKRNLHKVKNPSKDGNKVCKEGKSNVKEKREVVSNVNLIRRERKLEARNKKKDTDRGKKKRRRKRKRKVKKKKKKKKTNKKNSKKSKSRWPFKRNLLMLSEEEQIQASDCGNEWRIIDKILLFGKSGKTPDGKGRFKKPQVRGGQDCSNHKHPPNVDSSKYLESAHCLRFSNLWYSVYQLEEPLIAHKIDLQMYVKRSSSDGSMFWQDLTNGSTIRLGTFDKRYRDQGHTMDFTYNDIKLTPSAGYNLNPTKDRLLVPSTLSEDQSKYPEVEGFQNHTLRFLIALGWSGEYLVVEAGGINENANECDKAGVGFAAFVNQPDRCERARGTCLTNQPMDYWRHDVEARDSGRGGCYFLSNFGRVPSEAIKYNVNGTGSREFLALEYHSPHVSVIDVELRTDYNALLRAGSYGRLTEVYIDNTAIDYTLITVLVTNKGPSSASYRIRITECPKGLPASWLNAETPAKTMYPRRDHNVALNFSGSLSLDEFSCSVELLNNHGEAVAMRRIKVRKTDRCYCIRHCMCTCASEGTRCQPMTLDSYHAAGFRGPLPPITDQLLTWFDLITVVCLCIIGVMLLLLLLGVLKWMIGICLPAVSRWGLDALLRTHKMREYFEKDLKSRSVVFNELGQPVHPDTGRKSVRVCNRKLEFFLNSIFFFIHPLVVCCSQCMKPQHPSKSTLSIESKESLMSEKDESPTMIRVSTYGDSINSKMEAEDTKYVIDELKKSQGSLQNRSRYKTDSETPETVPSSSD